MKKIARNIIVAVLVLSLTLGIFAGCQKPVENISLAEKYGITMSDKTVTYDGEKHELAVSVDNTILQGKSYEVTYEYGGTVLTKAEFTDVGEYGITAKIKVAGDETVYPLTNKIIIKKAPLELEVGNLFLRQGQGMATLGNPRELFKDAAFIGKDTNAILGTLSFEIYNGNTKVNDISTLKPSASVATPYTAKIVGIKDLANYEVKLGEGKLYVLIDSEFDNAKSLKEEIATVPTTTTINTFDFFKMRAFASAADHIIKDYPSTTEIQRLMCGTVDVNIVKTLKKTADTRISTVYDIDKNIETAICEINFLGAEHSRNEQRAKGDKLTELRNIKSARSKAEYGDSIAFNVIVYDTVKYQFTSVMINGVEFTANGPGVSYTGTTTGKKPNNPLVYSFGTPGTTERKNLEDTAYGYSNTDATNPGVISGGVQISHKLLGAMDGKTTLTITPVIGQVFDAGIYKGSAITEITPTQIGNGTDAIANGYPELSNLTITSKGSTDYDIANGDITSDLVLGKEYKFTISTLTGYGVVSVEVGDKMVLASQMDNGSFTLKLTEDNLSAVNGNEVVKIIPTFEKVYSFAVKADTSGDPKTLSNSNKDGVFTSNAGTIKLGGVSSTNVPTIGEEKFVNLSIKPDSGWLIKEVVVYQGASLTASDVKKVDITADFEGTTVVPLDLSEKRFKDKLFDSKNEVNVIVKFRESYPIVVKATHGDNTVNMTYSAASGQFTSKFGTVEVLKSKNEQMSVISREGAYFLRLEKVDGYVPKKISINGKLVMSDGAGNYNEGIRYAMIKQNSPKNLALNNSINSSTTQGNSYNICVEEATSYDPTKMLVFDEKLSPGSECVIEIEYVAYYYVNLSKSGTALTRCEVEFGTYLTGSGDKYTVNGTPSSHTGEVNGINLVYVDNRAMINVNDTAFYCYENTNNLYARISATTETHKDGTTKKLIDPRIIIGCTGDYWDTSSGAHKHYTSVDDAVVLPTKPVDSQIAKLVSSKPILPGGEINIAFEASGYDSK